MVSPACRGRTRKEKRKREKKEEKGEKDLCD